MDAEQEYVTSGKVLLISEDKITFTQPGVIFTEKSMKETIFSTEAKLGTKCCNKASE